MHKSRRHKTAPQLSFGDGSGWGGKRRGAGRKNLTQRVSHGRREQIDSKRPLHLTIKICDKKWNLRCRDVKSIFARSSERAQRFGLHIVHYSMLRDHLHLIVEAESHQALVRGMRSFGSSFAKQFRKIVGGSGAVFHGRFHLNAIKNPTQMRNTLRYVLHNFSKHTRLIEHSDFYSSAGYFLKWSKLMGRRRSPMLEGRRGNIHLPSYLSPPRTWLAREGWERARVA